MARSDLLISLVKAGRQSPDPKFRATVEAIISEERAKQHPTLADELAKALLNGSASVSQSPNTSTPYLSSGVIGDLLYETAPEKTLGNLVLPRIVKEEYCGLLEEHQRADLLRSYGLAPRHRVLLVGPPGNGKTSVAQALAHDLLVPLLTVRYEGLIGSFLGETASRLRKIFDYARQRACVLFLDEFDTIGKERGDEHETGEIKRVVSTLLLQMDQLPAHVIIVTATNHMELLDRAVWRRFQIRLNLPLPGNAEICEFLRNLTAQIDLWPPKRDISKLALQMRGASYSEIDDFFRDVVRRVVLESPNPDLNKIINQRLTAWLSRVDPGTIARRRNRR